MSRVAEAEAEGDSVRTKMARVGRKYASLFELAALAMSENPPEDWASKLLRLMSSAGWADNSFLEELAESELVRGMCRALPVLKANAANRTTASSVQDLADLEESMRKLRHELALAEKRLPSHGVLGSGGSSFYVTWASIGHACTLMLQALTYGASLARSSGTSNAQGSPAPTDAARGIATAAVSSGPVGGAAGDAAATPQPVGPAEGSDGQAAATPAPAATPAAATGGEPGASTPRGGAPLKAPGAGAATSASPGSGGSMPALATESALIKMLGNKHVIAHAKEVMCVVPESYKAALARILLFQISTDMKATQAGLTHILQILQGDPATISPAPSTLPKTWFTTATLLTAYREALKPSFAIMSGAGDAGFDLAAFPAETTPGAPDGRVSDAASGEAVGLRDSASSPSGAAAPSSGTTAATAGGDGNGDVEMKEVAAAPPTEVPGRAAAPGPAPDGRTAGASAPSTPSARKDAKDAANPGSEGGSLSAAGAAPRAADAADDPRVILVQLLQGVASALCEAVTGAHGVGRMALLLRGEAAAKYPNAAAYMPAALSINELMGHLDGLTCVAKALDATDSIRSSVTSLLTSQAIKELLGAGKVYVTTVIAAGALTRDLAIDAVIPQSLRQGYMAAVLTPLETGALMSERRAPQVLAYRNSITESSYYQVMDAEALPYGVNVRFEDEQEAEGMGVVREWLSQIAADVFSPERGLFVRGAADRRVVHPAPNSWLQEDYLGYMRFAGRIVGLALRANVPLGVVLSTGLFNYLTGRRATLQDLQQIDPQVYMTCQNILSTSDAESLELFHVWHVPASGGSGSSGSGGEQEQELLPGGAALRVTDVNKAEYVALLAHHVVVTVVQEQCAAFLSGVQDTAHHMPDDARLRRAFLTPLLLEDLNRITAGESCLEPDDWAGHTDVAGFEGPKEHGCLDMFWQLVAEYRPEDRRRLLQFWTAMTHLPSGGFKALNQRLQIMKLGPSAARPAGGEPVADRPAGAAAAVATPANMQGPSTNGSGPHSHRLEGDSLEVDDPEHSDGTEEPPGETPPQSGAQPQQQHGGRVAAGGSTHAAAGDSGSGGFRGSGVGDAAPAAEADLAGRQGGAAAAAAAAAGAESAADADAAQLAEADAAAGRDGAGEGGDDVDIPYHEEDDGGDDGMDYDDEAEDEEEEFQRQLQMALALSLQDMSSATDPAPGSGSGGGAAGAAGPSGEGAGRADGEGGSSASAASEGPSAAATGSAPSDTDPSQREEAGAEPRAEAAGSAAAAGASSGAGSGPEPATSAGRGLQGDGAEAASSPPTAHDSTGGAAAPAPSEAAGRNDAGSGGGSSATGCAATSDDGTAVGVRSAPAEGPAATAIVAASASGAGPGEEARGTAGREDGGPSATLTAGAAAAAAASPAGLDSTEPMDTDGASGDAANPALAPDAAANNSEAARAGAPATDPSDAAAVADEAEAAAEVQEMAPGAAGVAEQQQERAQEDEREQVQAPESERERAGVGAQQQELEGGRAGVAEDQPSADASPAAEPSQGRQGEEPRIAEAGAEAAAEAGGGLAAAGTGAGGIAVADGGAAAAAAAEAEGAAAGSSSPSTSRALPLLPQARTCFLQLNLPVYGSLEDMRRAFAIALDNMSFGLH